MSASRVLLVSGSANFSTRDVWDGYRIALEDIGVGVIPYPTFSFLKVLSADTVCSDILGTAIDRKHGVDCVIFVDGLYFRGERARIPQSIQQIGIPTVLIATDDPYESIPNVQGLYTYRFTNEIRCAGEGVEYLPTATLPLPLLPSVPSPSYDISFVGTVFADRIPLLTAIADHCESARRRFLVAGKMPDGTQSLESRTFIEVRSGSIDEQEKLQIYAESKVVLNLFRETAQHQPADSPSPRVFEVTALGHAALLTGPERSEVRRIFGETVHYFQNARDAITRLEEILASNPQERATRIQEARQITETEHLYHHRAKQLVTAIRHGEQKHSDHQVAEDRMAWMIGCGRTGSTWLSEMLAGLPRIRRWHEPYFGRFLRHLQDRPGDRDRASSFFSNRYRDIWMEGLRNLFFQMVRHRYPQIGNHALVIKEVNTPEIYTWLRHLFPASRMILLVRDPFDVLDSYLDLQKPGSWNEQFGDRDEPMTEVKIERTAEHIRSTLELSLSAYSEFPVQQRLRVSYESLLTDPASQLQACASLLGVDLSPDDLEKTIEEHRFERHEKTGALEFRRHGKAGVWKASPNFNAETRAIAERILGPIRTRLGYRAAENTEQPGHGFT